MSRRRLLALASCAALIAAADAWAAKKKAPARPASLPSYGLRDDLLAFAAEVAERRGLERSWVVKQLAQARKVETVQRLMMPAPAGVAKNWAAYRDRFVEPRRVAAGAAFWQANAAWLQKAEARWGVPAQIVVAIIGVETFYGRMTGGFRVIDALATLSFDFPTGRKDRSPFFRGELEEFLAWCAREHTDPQLPKGSFAGAMGMAQFMPGSINRFAVDFDGDGRRELLAPDIVPSFSADRFVELGAMLPMAARSHDGPLALVMLENGDRAPTYVAGTENFYAITRYNWSSYYALAVISLGAALAQAVPGWQSAVGEETAAAQPVPTAPAAAAPEPPSAATSAAAASEPVPEEAVAQPLPEATPAAAAEAAPLPAAAASSPS